jgi:hypothetical protein
MRIKRHEKSYVVELSDGSVWRIWPGDLATTLGWLPNTDIEVVEIEHEVCSHALVDCLDGSKVRVTQASMDWPTDVVRHVLGQG